MNDLLLFLPFLVFCAVLLVAFIHRPSRRVSEAETFDPPAIPKSNYRPAYRKLALSEVAVRARIRDLPKAQVVHIKDGDSVIVTIGRDENEIRLDSIDCPEGGQPWGDTARYGLIKLIGGKTVLLEQHGQDHHGRTLATIYTYNAHKEEWINVNERMVMLGHAWVFRKYFDHLPPDRQEKLKRIERWARSKKVGLWHELNPIPPWNWRYESRSTFQSK